jgi:general secretion pathway protein G
LLELLIVSVIIGTLTTLVAPNYQDARERAKITRAVTDIGLLAIQLEMHYRSNDELPEFLADLGQAEMVDPWGYPYSYQRIIIDNTGKPAGEHEAPRKDKFLKPLNTDYDLYSIGSDGATKPALSTQVSQDDIVRAVDGAFIGLAADF